MSVAFGEDDPRRPAPFFREGIPGEEFKYRWFTPDRQIVGTILEGIDCEGESGWFAGVGADVYGMRGPFVFPVGLP